MVDETTETAQIERDLAKTRARMDSRLDELQDRLSPTQLVNDALSHFGGEDGADFTQGLIAKAKANPLPAGLIAAGAVWLMASSQHNANRRASKHPDLPTRLRSAEAGVVRLSGEHPDVHASRLDDARGQVLGVSRQASDTASTYAQRIKDAMTSAGNSVRETSHDLVTSMSDTASSLGNQASRVGHSAQGGAQSLSRSAGGAWSSITTNPVMLGAATALVGLLAGAIVPIGDEEEQALGTLADQLHSKGRDLAQEVVTRGAQVANETLEAVKDSAQAHGLTGDKSVGELADKLKSGELISQVKDAAQEVVSAGKESLRSQVSDADS